MIPAPPSYHGGDDIKVGGALFPPEHQPLSKKSETRFLADFRAENCLASFEQFGEFQRLFKPWNQIEITSNSNSKIGFLAWMYPRFIPGCTWV